MPDSRPSRLEHAMDLFLQCQEQGLDRDRVIAEHPELAETLQALFDDQGEGEQVADPQQMGDYRLGRELGRGGMGVVYAARQLSLGRDVALKMLDDGVGGNPTRIARFRREALTMARLDHPHVVRIFDVGQTDGRYWLAMELVDGESLAERLERLRQQGEHRAQLRALLEVVCQVATALEHVHQAGVLHRDVKPSNVLLRRDGRALLTDFGLARDDSSPTMTQEGTAAGTPHYMSPEQVMGGELDPRSDVFSLGALLYEVVTLERPFAGVRTDQVLRRILQRDPVDPRRVQRGLPPDLAAIVFKGLEKDPARRYQTAQAMGEDLRAFLDLRPVRAQPPSRFRRLRRWVRREPWQAALAGALLLCVVLGGFLWSRMPAVAAAELAEREAEYERAMATGDLARHAKNRAATLAAYERARQLFPERREPMVWWCLARSEFDSFAKALEEVEQRFGGDSGDEAVERLRAMLLQRLGRIGEGQALEQRLGTPGTPLAMMLAAASLLVDERPSDRVRAQQLMSLAVRMSTQPRLSMYVYWAGIAPPVQQQECAKAILALWPDEPLALQQAALCLVHSDPARAVELQRRVVASERVEGRPHFFLAMFAFRAGDTATAMAAARRAVREDLLPDDLRANLIEKLAGVDPAIGEAEAIGWLEREPKSCGALVLRAGQLAAGGERNQAEEMLSEALAQPVATPDVHAQFAVLQSQLGRHAEAMATAARVLDVVPHHAASHRALVAAAQAVGDADAGLSEQRRWLGVQPLDAEGWRELAVMLRSQPEGTREALAAVAQADWLSSGRDRRALMLRAELHEALGESVAAALCREQAAKLPAAK